MYVPKASCSIACCDLQSNLICDRHIKLRTNSKKVIVVREPFPLHVRTVNKIRVYCRIQYQRFTIVRLWQSFTTIGDIFRPTKQKGGYPTLKCKEYYSRYLSITPFSGLLRWSNLQVIIFQLIASGTTVTIIWDLLPLRNSLVGR
jgi:hypothetical protein